MSSAYQKKIEFFFSLAADADSVNSKSEKDNPMTQITVDNMPTSMPCVVVKTEPVDNDCPPESLESNAGLKI